MTARSALPSDPIGRFLRDLRRATGWHRRLLAGGLLAGAVATGMHAVEPARPPTRAVLVAARDLAAGARLADGDLRVARVAEDAVPAGALGSGSPVVGRDLAAPARRGEVLTDVRLVGRSLLRGLRGGLVAAPVRVADPEMAALLRTGDVVDVLGAASPDGLTAPAAAEARVIASAVRVLSVPREDGSGSFGDGALVLVATSSATAARLAAAAVTDRLSVVLRR